MKKDNKNSGVIFHSGPPNDENFNVLVQGLKSAKAVLVIPKGAALKFIKLNKPKIQNANQ